MDEIVRLVNRFIIFFRESPDADFSPSAIIIMPSRKKLIPPMTFIKEDMHHIPLSRMQEWIGSNYAASDANFPFIISISGAEKNKRGSSSPCSWPICSAISQKTKLLHSSGQNNLPHTVIDNAPLLLNDRWRVMPELPGPGLP
jgi:hypothetical protein